MSKENTLNISHSREALKSIETAHKLLSQLPGSMSTTVARLKTIVENMKPDVRTSFIPLLQEEVTSILNGQNKFSMRITRLMTLEGASESNNIQRNTSAANDELSELSA